VVGCSNIDVRLRCRRQKHWSPGGSSTPTATSSNHSTCGIAARIPNFRDRAPRIVKGEKDKERLVIEEHTVGTAQRGIGSKAQPLVGHHRLGPA
jgi:hypothetical protein